MKPNLHTVTIIVRDLSKSIAFYRMLGLEIPDGMENESHVDCTASGNMNICLVPETTVKQHRPGWQYPGANGAISLHFKCANQGDVDVMYTQFMNEEYTSSMLPSNTPWGERYAQVFDPDGNTIALFASLH